MQISMKLTALAVTLFAASSLAADTLVMRDGRSLSGEFIGSTARSVHLRTAKGIERFALRDVRTIRLEPREANSERTKSAPVDRPGQRALIVGQGQAQSIERVTLDN